MARHGAGRYAGKRKDCIEIDVILRERDWSGIVPVSHRWCQQHGMWLRECAVCGRDFHTLRKHTKYCSTGCSQYAYRQRCKSSEVSA